MKTKTIEVYYYSELSDAAKEKARRRIRRSPGMDTHKTRRTRRRRQGAGVMKKENRIDQSKKAKECAARINPILRQHETFDSEEKQTSLVDILTDMRHWADRWSHHDVDFHAALNTSYEHYLAERNEK